MPELEGELSVVRSRRGDANRNRLAFYCRERPVRFLIAADDREIERRLVVEHGSDDIPDVVGQRLQSGSRRDSGRREEERKSGTTCLQYLRLYSKLGDEEGPSIGDYGAGRLVSC